MYSDNQKGGPNGPSAGLTVVSRESDHRVS